MGASKTSEEDLEPILLDLAARLRRRVPEAEAAFVARIRDLAEAWELAARGEYLEALPAVSHDLVDTAISAVEQGESWSPTIPPSALALLRLAVRDGVTLDEFLRAYTAGYNLLSEFLLQEVAQIPRETLSYIGAVQSRYADRVISMVSAEYLSEVERLDRSPGRRLAERVQQLLTGAPAGTDGLGYDFEAWHIGLIAVGNKAELTIRGLAERLGCKPLIVPRGTDIVWAWLGARRSISFAELERHASPRSGAALAVGEPRRGLEGWRLTHGEAQLAFTVMRREPEPLTRCTDVLLHAAVMRDDAAARFLLDAYIEPLDRRKDASVLKQTLRAYFELGGNAASAAASLDVDRHTVQRRLQRVEESIGRPLDTCRAELEVALRIERLASRDGSGPRA